MLSGTLLKLGGGTITRLQEREFRLSPDGSTLDYFENGKAKGSIEVRGSTIIDRGTYMGHLCFSIEGRNNVKEATKEYFLFTDDRAKKWRWVSGLQAASGKYTFLDNDAANRVRLQDSSLNTILARPGNDTCADCSAPVPSWAVVLGSASNTENLGGVFVCIECIGVHRGLWPDRCKEVVLDEWSSKEIEKMSQGGNGKVNGILEYNTCGGIKPNRYSLRDVREAYIKAKYEGRDGKISGAFSRANHSAPGPSIVVDNGTKASAEAAAANLPPRYIGVVLLNVHQARNFPVSNAVIAINNGYQEVKSLPSSKGGVSGPEWNQLIPVGIDTIHRPMYGTIFDDNKIAGTVEIILASHFKDRELCDDSKANVFTVGITGNGVPLEASITFSAHLNRLA